MEWGELVTIVKLWGKGGPQNSVQVVKTVPANKGNGTCDEIPAIQRYSSLAIIQESTRKPTSQRGEWETGFNQVH